MEINHLMAHLFHKAIPTIAISAAQNLSLIASCHLWRFTWHVDFLRTLHQVAKYPYDFPVFPDPVVPHYELDYPVFHCEEWLYIFGYHEDSLAYHVWLCCPPVVQSSSSVFHTEESMVDLLAKCAPGSSLDGNHHLAKVETMGWQRGHPVLKQLFSYWESHAPVGLVPHFTQFPVLLSCVISRLIPSFDLPLASPKDYMMTCSQFYFYWYKAICALDRLIGAEARIEFLKDVFAHAPTRGGSTYTYKGDVLLTLMHLVLDEYIGFQQPSFITVFQELSGYARLTQFELGYSAKKYLLDVYTGKLRESFLDPIFHFFILDHLALPSKFPTIFTRTLPVMDWSFFFTPATLPPTATRSFQPKCLTNDYMNYFWPRYQKFDSYPELIASLRFKDGTVTPPFTA
jgi:hypothetical protein